MKKIIWIFALFPLSAFAMSDGVRLDMLNAQIATLEKQYAEKYAELKQCEKTTKGFKIAGISTLAATGVGIYANIALHEKLKKLRNAGSGNAAIVRTASEEQAQDKELCQIDPALC
ncbi:MAG: hypothetical protein NC311_03805 [Muribaculaceae bacterium]|nr:hypothetical protein [Muribaculaceae bacterium]